MNLRDIVKNAPNPILWVCGTVVLVTVIAAFVVFGVTNSDATEFRAFLNILLNVVSVVFAGGAMVTAGAAAKSSATAAEQTNGALDSRIREAVKAANQDYGVTSVEGGNASGRPTV